MKARGVDGGLDKRKVCVFLLLVGIGLLCVGLMAYTLFYARPHANPTIQESPHSSLRSGPGAAVHS
jgi:hypothetical protein